MAFTKEEKIQKYRNADETVKELYTNEALSEHINLLLTHFEITNPYNEVSEIIGDTILGFYKIADMPRLFQQKLEVTPEVAQKMTAELIEFLSPVVQREESASAEVAQSKATLMQTFANPQPKEEREVSSQPHSYVTPLRTMERDMTRIHGYGVGQQAPQEEIENPSNTEDTIDVSSQSNLKRG